MDSKHIHAPVSTRARCPVCHQAVYSRAGIHPQCAMKQSEPPKPKPKSPTDDLVVLDSGPVLEPGIEPSSVA